MNSQTLQMIFSAAAAALKPYAAELSAIDAETGDGDHGFAVLRITDVMIAESEKPPRERAEDYFDDLCLALLKLNGGSAGNLWGVMMEGVGVELAKEPRGLAPCVRGMLRGAIRGVAEISDAKPGEKTLLDTLVPALETAETAPESDRRRYLEAVAASAWDGAASTEHMVARYGRAKNLLGDSRGHRDPGAVSMAMMIGALARAAMEVKA